MQAQFEEILNYLQGIWIKRRYILIAAWLLCPLGWFGVSLIPDSYKSTARVYVDTDSVLAPLLEGMTIEVDSNDKVNLMVKTLLSRTNLERIARMTDLDLQAADEREYEIMLQDLTDDFYISKEKRDNIYTLSIQNKDPVLAKNIVEAALSVFIENTLVDNRQDSNEALRFIDSQIRDYKDRLEKAELAISDFKRKNSTVLPDYAKGFYAHLNDERTRLSESILELAVVESELEKSKAQLFDRPDSTIFSSSYDQRILALQQELDNLMVKYTEEHPSVFELRERILQLKQFKKDEITKFEAMTDEEKRTMFDVDSESQVLQELQLHINELEARNFALGVRVKSYKSRVTELVKRIDLIPEVEATLTALNRNYEINKSQYEDLLSRRESALLASNREESTDSIRFETLEPPRVPIKPEGPKRILFLIAVTFAAFGVGVGLSFVHSQIRPVAQNRKQIITELELPVYGSVFATESSGLPKWESRKKWIFIISNVLLFSCLIAICGYYMMDTIEILLKKVM